MFAPSFFEQLEDRLNLAVYDINQDIEMGVFDWRNPRGEAPAVGSKIQAVSVAHTEPVVEVTVTVPDTQVTVKLSQRDRMPSKMKGLAQKMALLQHEAEAQAEKLDTKVEGVAAKMPGVFSNAHGVVDGLAQNLGDVETFISSIESVTNGGPPLDEPK